jgi:hypothetical protein
MRWRDLLACLLLATEMRDADAGTGILSTTHERHPSITTSSMRASGTGLKVRRVPLTSLLASHSTEHLLR